MHYVTAEEMKRVDDAAVSLGMPIQDLMRIAGNNIARLVRRFAEHKVTVLCGKGNNGGDGIVAAYHLATWGVSVTTVLAYPRLYYSTYLNQTITLLERMNNKLVVYESGGKTDDVQKAFASSELVLDSLIGYSLQGNPKEPIATLIRAANESKQNILAVDVPSGLDATSGRAYVPCIRAYATATLALPKRGIMLPAAREYVGKVYLLDIGMPAQAYEKAGVPYTTPFAVSEIVEVQR